jgi:hypothetical protein
MGCFSCLLERYTSSLPNSENQLAAKPALTWRPGWRSGQWHPTSGQLLVLGATELGFVRSVLHFPDCSSFDRKLVLIVTLLEGFGPPVLYLNPESPDDAQKPQDHEKQGYRSREKNQG